MRLKYVGKDELDIPSLAVIVKTGDEVDATGDSAKSLLAQQIFERVDTSTESKEEK